MHPNEPVEKIGFDLHTRASQLAILTEDGEIVELRIPSTRDGFTRALGARPQARILLEAGTESEWVAAFLEGLGHEVIVADPNFAPMYATLSRKIKTDRRDALALLDACRLGAYRPAHRTSAARRHVRAELSVRDALVRTRARYITLAKACVRRDGLRIAPGASHRFLDRLAAVPLPDPLAQELAPLVTLLTPLNREIAAADERITTLVAQDAVMQRLLTAPGVGPVTAAAFVATLDTITRFRHAAEVMAYVGLVPSEDSSAERRQRGAITKAGNARVRWLLVEAAWGVLRSTREDTAGLRAWGQRLVLRRGKRVAVVAIARRLAGILYAMWRDDTVYGRARGPAADAVRPAPDAREAA
jgi:transposase